MIATGFRPFALGRTVMTQGVAALVKEGNNPAPLLHRHLRGDWGDVDEGDAQLNNESTQNDSRILSAYKLGGEKVWIITEADRSVTTILLPEEY